MRTNIEPKLLSEDIIQVKHPLKSHLDILHVPPYVPQKK